MLTLRPGVRALPEIYTEIDHPVAIQSIVVAKQDQRPDQFRALDRYRLEA